MIFDGSNGPQQHKTALLVGHPGHELRVYHWLELNHPEVGCLTDGSGGIEEPRMDSTLRLLSRAGAVPGAIFSQVSDKALYRMLLDGQMDFFAGLVEDLSQSWIAAGVTEVVGDAAEGFNPTHDICRFIIDAAVARMRLLTGREVRNLEFALQASPNVCPDHLRERAVWLHLDDQAMERKVAAAFDYAELKTEVEAALQHYGTQAFATECLYPSNTEAMLKLWEHEPPAYDRHGRQRVSEGRYQDPIFYRQHVAPVIQAVQDAAKQV